MQRRTDQRGPRFGEAHIRAADVKAQRAGRSQIGAGTSEIRRMLIGRELYTETS